MQSPLLSSIVFCKLQWYLKNPLSLSYQSLQCFTVLDTMKTLIIWKYNRKSDYADYWFSNMQVTLICHALSMLHSPFRERLTKSICIRNYHDCAFWNPRHRKPLIQVWIHEFVPLIVTVPVDFHSVFVFL